MNVELNLNNGWARFTFDDGRNRHTISCSNIVDTVGDRLRALAKTQERSCKVEFQATDESRHDFLISVRSLGDKMEVVVKKVLALEGLAGLKNENWRVIARLRDDQTTIRGLFAKALKDAIEPLGQLGYRKNWGHELPLEEYQLAIAH